MRVVFSVDERWASDEMQVGMGNIRHEERILGIQRDLRGAVGHRVDEAAPGLRVGDVLRRKRRRLHLSTNCW